jgi:hypothetical protein
VVVAIVAAGAIAVAVAIIALIATSGTRGKPKATPILVADSASVHDTTLSLNEALQPDADSAKALAAGIAPRFYGKTIVYCTDPLAAEVIKTLQGGCISLASSALRDEPVANFLRESSKSVDLPAGVITVVEVAPTGDVVRSEAPRITAIQFRYAPL